MENLQQVWKYKAKFLIYGEDNIIHYSLSEKQDKEGLYIPIGSFITSYAREKTIRTSQKIKDYSINKYGKDMYIYSDTDSIKTLLPIEELKQFCEIDDIKLGYWKNEGRARKGKWIRQKCYLEEFYKPVKYSGKINNKKRKKLNKKIKTFNNFREIHITCSGMPTSCYKYVEWDKFKTGFTCSGKLTFKHVIGGVKLVETEFTIKEEKFTSFIEKNKK